MKGTTSGTVTLTTAAAAGTYTLTLPTDDGTANQVLTTNGSGVLSWTSSGGGGLANVVEDTTPELGGNLDGQTYHIVTTGHINGSDFTATAAVTAVTFTAGNLSITDGSLNDADNLVDFNDDAVITSSHFNGADFTATAEINGATIVATSSIEIPNADGPTVDEAGEIAYDTSEETLIAYNGSAAHVLAHHVYQYNFTIANDGDWDTETVPLWQAPKDMAVTIVQVDVAVLGSSTPTLTFNIEARGHTTLNSAGTDIFSADKVADADGLEITTVDNPAVGARDHLVLTTAAAADSGTVDYITGTIYYTKDVE